MSDNFKVNDSGKDNVATTAFSKKKKILLSLLFVLTVVFFLCYLGYQKYYPSTEDAYVNANITHIASQATGKVLKVYVVNNQYVKKGELLFSIDPQHYDIELDSANSDVKLYNMKLKSDLNTILSAKASLKESDAKMVLENLKFHRMGVLHESGVISKEDYDEANSNYKIAKAQLESAQLSIAHAKSIYDIDGAYLLSAKARLGAAKLNLSYTKVYASSDGYITNFSLRQGSMISIGDNLFSLVSSVDLWVDANYKESDLERIKIGQPVQITLDMYPGDTIKGTVRSISAGSGSAFSLFPAENASGNWVKVSQRFPVKIVINQPYSGPRLRVGASANVEIDTI
jgi:membrane fusion protein, multidrug efflux system